MSRSIALMTLGLVSGVIEVFLKMMSSLHRCVVFYDK